MSINQSFSFIFSYAYKHYWETEKMITDNYPIIYSVIHMNYYVVNIIDTIIFMQIGTDTNFFLYIIVLFSLTPILMPNGSTKLNKYAAAVWTSRLVCKHTILQKYYCSIVLGEESSIPSFEFCFLTSTFIPQKLTRPLPPPQGQGYPASPVKCSSVGTGWTAETLGS